MVFDIDKIKDYQKISFVRVLGIQIMEISEDEACGKMKVKKNMKNYMSYLHGGVIASFIDTIAFFPGKLLPSGRKITTTSLEVKYIRPVTIGEVLTAKAKILHLGKKIGIIEVTVTNPEEKLVAKGTVSVINI
ncbi:MAG: PaaI family thioesterase [Proteobacteria bacterium]|nr:PaaI family thioesterase [Pseudomonadota bacterium]